MNKDGGVTSCLIAEIMYGKEITYNLDEEGKRGVSV